MHDSNINGDPRYCSVRQSRDLLNCWLVAMWFWEAMHWQLTRWRCVARIFALVLHFIAIAVHVGAISSPSNLSSRRATSDGR